MLLFALNMFFILNSIRISYNDYKIACGTIGSCRKVLCAIPNCLNFKQARRWEGSSLANIFHKYFFANCMRITEEFYAHFYEQLRRKFHCELVFKSKRVQQNYLGEVKKKEHFVYHSYVWYNCCISYVFICFLLV